MDAFTKIIENHTPTPLPVLPVTHRSKYAQFAILLNKLIKKQGLKVITGQPVNLEADCKKFIDTVWDEGYNKGLKDMDTMHGLADNS